MRCHYCDRDAAFAPERNGIRVGLCEDHFREQFEELADAEALAVLEELDGELDVDR